MVISLPLNAAIAKYQKTLQERQMKIKDTRTRLMNEVRAFLNLLTRKRKLIRPRFGTLQIGRASCRERV